MSFDEPVQPDLFEGQGGEGESPYAEYLNRVPEEVRDQVEPIFKEWDGNVTRRFQEASQFRKEWEPLADTGINQLSPEDVAYMVQLRQAMDDPQTMQQWWDGYAQQNGLAQQQAEEQPFDGQDFGEYQDPSQQLEQLLEQKLGPISQTISEFQSWREQQDMQVRQQEALAMIEGQLEELKAKHGDEFNRDAIELFIPNFIESDPRNAVPLAFEAYQKMRNDIEKGALQGKINAPAPAESGGVADVSAPKFTRFDDPALKEEAMQILRNSR